jgi:hypothetical protein
MFGLEVNYEFHTPLSISPRSRIMHSDALHCKSGLKALPSYICGNPGVSYRTIAVLSRFNRLGCIMQNNKKRKLDMHCHCKTPNENLVFYLENVVTK